MDEDESVGRAVDRSENDPTDQGIGIGDWDLKTPDERTVSRPYRPKQECQSEPLRPHRRLNVYPFNFNLLDGTIVSGTTNGHCLRLGLTKFVSSPEEPNVLTSRVLESVEVPSLVQKSTRDGEGDTTGSGPSSGESDSRRNSLSEKKVLRLFSGSSSRLTSNTSDDIVSVTARPATTRTTLSGPVGSRTYQGTFGVSDSDPRKSYC